MGLLTPSLTDQAGQPVEMLAHLKINVCVDNLQDKETDIIAVW